MTVITIPKKLRNQDLVLITRKEYEELLREKLKNVKEEPMTPRLREAFKRAEKNLKAGKTLSFDELSRKLGFTNRPGRL